MRLPSVIARDGPSRRLLGRVLRGEVDPVGLAGEDRARFLQAAEVHGLAALLEKRAPELAPAAMGVRFTAILAGATTVKAVRALEAAGIEVLVLKGLAVACLAWDDPSSRVQTDVDLLVRRAELHRAIAALQGAGVCGEVAISGDVQHAATLAPGPGGGATLELHHALSDDALQTVPIAELFARSLEVSTPEGPVRTLAHEDAAVFLSVHAALHVLDRLAWLVDLAGLARRQRVDWELAARRARAWRAEVSTLVGWRAAVELAGAAIPAEAFAALGVSAPRRALALGLLDAARRLEHPARRPLAVAFRLACNPSPAEFVHKLRAVREKERGKARLAR